MDSPEDLLGPDSLGPAVESAVDETHYSATLGTGLGHDRALRSRIDKRLHFMLIDFDLDVEHRDVAEALGSVLLG